VVVTGIGTVSALGTGREALARALRESRSGIAPIPPARRDRSFAPGSRAEAAGLARDFDPGAFVAPLVLRRLDRAAALAIAAGTLAVRDAGLVCDPERTAIALGTGGAGIESTGAFFRGLAEQGPAAASPMVFANTVSNGPAGQLAIALGATGPNATFAERGVAAEDAIAYGALLLEAGRADAVLAGSVDEVNGFVLEAYDRYGALAPGGRARPFDAARCGVAIGEGASVLVLEREDRAKARGARIYAAIAALDQANVPASRQEAPGRRALALPRSAAPLAAHLGRLLAAAGGAAARLGWVNASASGARALDALEAAALAAALGEGLARVPVSSIKGAAGEMLSSGGLRAAASCMAIAEGLIPATVGLERPDPALPAGLDLVRGAARERPLEAVLQTGLAEGGGATSILWSRI
jgi:3-oxoacyl-[acyl-carrier-protein] synthase II